MALLLLAWAGCATMDRGQALVPTRYQVDTGLFVVYPNAPMPEDPPAVRCLQALERDVGRELGLRPPAGEDRVQIYVLDNRQDFDHFLKFHYPELPHRGGLSSWPRGRRRLVYTYSSPRLEEDLRHEATHALLRGAFGDLPLWLDEGLAEYFENDLSATRRPAPRLDAIAADRAAHGPPNLERLESLTDIRQMSQRDYREAWAWVHLMLNGPEPGKSILRAYLSQEDRAETASRLRPRLAEAKIDDGATGAVPRALAIRNRRVGPGPRVPAPGPAYRALAAGDAPRAAPAAGGLARPLRPLRSAGTSARTAQQDGRSTGPAQGHTTSTVAPTRKDRPPDPPAPKNDPAHMTGKRKRINSGKRGI